MLEKLIVMVEEYSMKVMLELLLPKMLGEVEFQIIHFQCKTDLLDKLPARLKGYRYSLTNDAVIMVLLDRDNDDCLTLKKHLENIAINAGFKTKTNVEQNEYYQVINRIVIEELESWFFGDWTAVRKAYPRLAENTIRKEAYRIPDDIRGGTWEAFERELQKSGYFKTGLRKNENARQIAQYMNPADNQSKSFQVFRDAINSVMVGTA